MLHHSTAHVDAAYSDRPSSMVCLPVCRSVTVMSPAKMTEAIKIPFALWTWVDPRNYVLDGGADLPWEGALLRRKRGGPL